MGILNTDFNIYSYINSFNYGIWSENTILQICNVPWDSSYRDVWLAKSKNERDTYFEGLKETSYNIQLTAQKIVKPFQPIRIDIPFGTAINFNYVHVHNPIVAIPNQDDESSIIADYYYFIDDVTYIAPNTTQLNIHLDVWTTYAYDTTFKQAYVERGHAGIAADCATGYHRLYCDINEGLEIGNDYMISNKIFKSFMTTNSMAVLVISSIDLNSDFGTVSSPNLNTTKGGVVDHVPAGCQNVLFTINNYSKLCETIADYPWIEQGFQAIYAIPYEILSTELQSTSDTVHGIGCKILNDIDFKNFEKDYTIYTNACDNNFEVDSYTNFRNIKKLRCYPYSIIEISNFSSSPLVAKPELFAGDSIQIKILASFVAPSLRAMVTFPKYNAGSYDTDINVAYTYTVNSNTSTDQTTIRTGEFLDFALPFTNWPTLQMVTNNYELYLASNANSIAYSFQNAEWSQNKSVASAQNSYANTQVGIAANSQSTNISNNARSNSSYLNAGAGLLGAAVTGGLGAGNAVNAASGLASTMISNSAQTQLTGISNASTEAQASNNYSLAQWAAKGDYQNEIAGIQAKLQDTKLTQPSVVGGQGGEMFNFSKGLFGVLLTFKTLDPIHMRSIGNYLLKYGYAIETFFNLPENLQTCTNFDYWKCRQVYLSGTNIPETYKETLRGILEKGVTVWHNVSKLGNCNLDDNDPLNIVCY